MTQNAAAPHARLVVSRGLLLKSAHHHDGMYRHGAGYYLLNGRWHKLHKDKPAPKGAPVVAHPGAGGTHAAVAHFTQEQWDALKLPDTNTNAPSYNKALAHLQQLSDAGNVTGMLAVSYGSNTYGQKLAKVANHLLGLHGSQHKVAPGQKAGTHAALQSAPAEPHPSGLPEHLAPKTTPDLQEPGPLAPLAQHVKDTLDEKAAEGNVDFLKMVAANNPEHPQIVAYANKLLERLGANEEQCAPAAGTYDHGGIKKPISGKNDESGTLSNAATGWLHAYQWGVDSPAGDVKNPIPSDDVIKELSAFVGKSPVKLYRAVYLDANDSGKLVESWTRHEEHASVLVQSNAEMGKKMKIISQVFQPADIIVDTTKLPKKFHNANDSGTQAEVVIALGSLKKHVAKLRATTPAPAAAAGPSLPPGAKLTSDINSAPMLHTTSPDAAASIQKDGFKPAANSMYGKGVYFSSVAQSGDYGSAILSATLKPHKQLQLAKDSDASKAFTALTGLPVGQMGSEKGLQAMLDAGVGSMVFPVDGETYTVVFDPGLIDVQADAAAGPLTMPTFDEGKTTTGVVDYYKKVAQNVIDHGYAGNGAVLVDMKQQGLKPNAKGKVSNTWLGKTANSKKLLALHAAALLHATGGGSDGPHEGDTKPGADGQSLVFKNGRWHKYVAADESGEVPPVLVPVADAPAPAAAPAVTSETGNLSAQQLSNLQSIPWFKLKLPAENTNAKSHNAALDKIEAMAFAGDTAGLQAFIDAKGGAKQTYAKKQVLTAQTALAGLQQPGATAAVPVEPSPAKPSAPLLSGVSADTAIASFKAASPHASLADFEAKWKEANAGKVGLNAEWAMAANPAPAAPPPAAHFGPKEGDTKHGADGMLVLKDGHWVKVGAEPAAVKKLDLLKVNLVLQTLPSHLAPQAKFSSNHASKMALAAASAGDADGMAAAYSKAFDLGYEKTAGHIKAVADAMGVDTSKWNADRAAAPAAAPMAPPGAKPANSDLPSMDSWVQTGGQGGSNPGGKFRDADGVEWYCKFPPDEGHARSEVLAAKLYEAAGLKSQDAKLVTKGGKLGIASRWVDVKKVGAEGLQSTPGALSGFVVDAWLANWDVVGMGYDNLQAGSDGRAMRVDAGGSLQYRAQGAAKPFGHKVEEIQTMRDAKKNPQAAAVFGSLTTADMTASAKKVLSISDDQIHDLVMAHGPGDVAKKAELIEALIARKEDIAKQFPKALPKEKVKPKPDPTKLKVSADQLPKPHDFKNWKGAGSGLSSKAHVNDANQAAEQALLDTALKGNLIALKDYHFDALDKETGAVVGKKPISDHPSNYVKTYWSDLVSTLSFIAYPPEALKKFKSVVATSITKVSDAFKSAKYGTTTKGVEANSRLAFWIALGSTKPAESLLPPGASLEFQSSPTGQPKVTPAMSAHAQAAYQGLNAGRPVKRFINGIQSSGSYNDNFRDGRMVTTDGWDAAAMVLDAYGYATEKPEGFELYKWISFPGDMGKQMLSAPPGTVFQNPGSMCCSTGHSATSGFGSDRVRIRYAPGAKAVDSFGSGSHTTEKEITTLPGQRFVILKCHKVMCPVKKKERIELDVLMLPPDPTYVAELETMKGKHGGKS